jgi:hypothetical protein
MLDGVADRGAYPPSENAACASLRDRSRPRPDGLEPVLGRIPEGDVSARHRSTDDSNWDRLRRRFVRFVRTRTADQWIMFFAGALIGAILA